MHAPVGRGSSPRAWPSPRFRAGRPSTNGAWIPAEAQCLGGLEETRSARSRHRLGLRRHPRPLRGGDLRCPSARCALLRRRALPRHRSSGGGRGRGVDRQGVPPSVVTERRCARDQSTRRPSRPGLGARRRLRPTEVELLRVPASEPAAGREPVQRRPQRCARGGLQRSATSHCRAN